MKHKETDFVIFTADNEIEVYTWVKRVYPDGGYYLLDFEDSEGIESQVRSYDAPNFTVPKVPKGSVVDNYHRDTMIDRIVAALQFSKIGPNIKVTKYERKIIFETVVTNPKILEDKDASAKFTGKYNKIVATIQERFNGRWGVDIPVELSYPLKKVALNSIKI